VPPDRAVQAAQRLISRNPRDAGAYLRLGDAYIQKARTTGDVAYYSRAEEAIRKSLELAPDMAGAWRHLAYVYSARHEFPGAAAHAARAIELDPGDADAHGVLGDARLELGRYDEAEAAYRRMIALGESLAAYSRLSGLKNLRGDTAGAMHDLRRAIALGRANGEPRESVAWAQWQLAGEQFAVGDLAGAEAGYADALATQPGYYRALAGLAQVRAAQRRFDEAVDLYAKALAVVPLPEYAAALGDVHTRLGRAQDAKKQYELVEYVGRLSALNQVLYNRELAMFYADHDVALARALELAEREVAARRDVYAHDLLAWALLKNGRPREALAPMTEALRLGTRDARLFFHAGMIHHALGDRERARAYLERALATNPHFHVLQAELAQRTLRELELPAGGTTRP
jgi:tetratricopeptide (TPR) repeat protein